MNILLKEYAKLAVRVGASVHEGKVLVINSPASCYEFTRLLVEEAYLAGAKKVEVNFNDDVINHSHYQYCDVEVLKNTEDWVIKKFEYYKDEEVILLSISAPTPGLMADIDPKKIQEVSIASSKRMAFFREYQGSPRCQWSIVAMPTVPWAKKVYPNDSDEVAYEKLLKAILDASRVREDGTSVEAWNEHVASIRKHNDILNEYNFKSLHFKNGLGTDLTVELVKDHIWCGGDEVTSSGVHFNPNIPTEESFTCPDKFGVNGVVYATKPLNYGGNLIEDFFIKFENGKAVEFGAKNAEESLKSLIEFDEGSCYLGEVALVEDDSPISQSGILFMNTLFDENASCHLALGRCYSINIKDGVEKSVKELEELHCNNSLTHVDFMFGSADMEVIGETHSGEKVVVMKNGNFVF